MRLFQERQRISFYLIIIIMSGLWLLQPGDSLADSDAASDALVDKIVNQWKERESKTKSFNFYWEGEHFDNADMASSFAFDKNNIKPTVPDNTFLMQRRLLNERDRVRDDETGRRWSNEKKTFVPNARIDIFDGTQNTLFFFQTQEGYPVAFVDKNRRNQVGREVWTWPLRMVYRPFGSSLYMFSSDKITLGKREAADVKGDIVALYHGDGTVWVDMSKDCSPVRYKEEFNGRDWDVTIDYKHDEKNGWVPDSWTIKYTSEDGKVLMSERMRITEYTINAPIAYSDFQIILPLGTWVSSHDPDIEYLIRPNGQLRPILPGEFNGKNYQQLLDSEPKKP